MVDFDIVMMIIPFQKAGHKRNPKHTEHDGIYNRRFFLSMSSSIKRSPADITEASRFDPVVNAETTDDPFKELVLNTFFLRGLPTGLSGLSFTGGLGPGAAVDDSGGWEDNASVVISGLGGPAPSASSEPSVLGAGGDDLFPIDRMTFSASRFRPSSTACSDEPGVF